MNEAKSDTPQTDKWYTKYHCYSHALQQLPVEMRAPIAGAVAMGAEICAGLERELSAARAEVDRWRKLALTEERESAHWKRMYECAQNANALRQDVLDGQV